DLCSTCVRPITRTTSRPSTRVTSSTASSSTIVIVTGSRSTSPASSNCAQAPCAAPAATSKPASSVTNACRLRLTFPLPTIADLLFVRRRPAPVRPSLPDAQHDAPAAVSFQPLFRQPVDDVLHLQHVARLPQDADVALQPHP